MCETFHGYYNVDGEQLQDVSATGRERPWGDKKMKNELLAVAYDEINPKKALRLRMCATELTYAHIDGKAKLVGADFCRVRLCPMCGWRRSLKVAAQTITIVDAIKADHRITYILLTLTMRNCEPHELDGAITALLRAYNKLTNTDDYKAAVKGSMRTVEVTHNIEKDTYHPHIHALLAVKPDYFRSKSYITQERWTELWQRVLKADYVPIVDVRKVRGQTGKAIAEVAKYAVKDSDYIIPDDWNMTEVTVRVLDAALANRRFVAYGGLLKDYHKKLNLTDADKADLVTINEDKPPIVPDGVPVYTYFWAGYRQI